MILRLAFVLTITAIPAFMAVAFVTGEWRWLLVSGAAWFLVRMPT